MVNPDGFSRTNICFVMVLSKEFIMEMLEHDLKTIKSYAKAVLSMFESGRLKVRDVRLEEEE